MAYFLLSHVMLYVETDVWYIKNVTVPYQYQVSYNKYFYGIHATSTDVDGYL